MIGNKRIENGNFYFYYQNDKYYGYAYINFMRYTNILEPTKEEITIYNGLINNNPIQSGYNSIDGLFINYPHKLDKGLSKWHNYNRLYSGSNCILKNQNIVAIDPNLSDLIYCINNKGEKFRYTQDQRRKETKAKKYRNILQENKLNTIIDDKNILNEFINNINFITDYIYLHLFIFKRKFSRQ